ncbi:MAG: hypothetical protein AB7I79_12020 [Rhizobiaceae bacterium]
MPDTNRDFAELLDELLAADDAPPAGGPAPHVPFDHLALAEELDRIRVAGGTVEAEYREVMETPELAAELETLLSTIEPVGEEVALSVDPAEIARELGIDVMSKPAELARRRRAFAFANHPDRVPSHLRDRALARMKIANRLIDDARQQARPR